MAEIKMRINNDRESHCFNCNALWKNTSEMYDLRIGYNKIRTLPLCKKCVDALCTKTLKASVIYNAKLKSKEDQKRIMRERSLEEEENEQEHLSINKAMKGMKFKED